MPELDLNTRPLRHFSVRRRVLKEGVYLIRLTQLVKLNEASDRLWRMCDGAHSIADIAIESDGMDLQWVCTTLLILQNAGMLAPLHVEAAPTLPAERFDWEASPALQGLLATAVELVDGASGGAVRELPACVDRVFRLSYEAYFARYGTLYNLNESAFRTYWVEQFLQDPVAAARQWLDQFDLKSLHVDAERRFCRVGYGDVVYEGYLGHRH